VRRLGDITDNAYCDWTLVKFRLLRPPYILVRPHPETTIAVSFSRSFCGNIFVSVNVGSTSCAQACYWDCNAIINCVISVGEVPSTRVSKLDVPVVSDLIIFNTVARGCSNNAICEVRKSLLGIISIIFEEPVAKFQKILPTIGWIFIF